ncbi:MAG TPA: EamA family transporter [Pseudomonas sp.]|uniref:EamA family transporter n=1 Tax=Pseudomonas sp. TaxID=306 RepID=UPI002B526F20|nr:EamA family transporter [Pseudomonas sp.]HTO19425.1 EamA family transporter [Pseudomonas sp.]
MPLKDVLLALVVITVWGLNFVVIKIGLQGVPPLLLGALRFLLVLFPAIFFIPRPRLPWRWLLAYGLTISLGQFAFLFYAMSVGMPAGLASLVLQAQAFLTLLFAVPLLGERVRTGQWLGLLVAATGLTLIGLQSGQGMTLAGFALTLCAASMWALGNIVSRRIGRVDILGLVIWGALVPPLPFLALSLWLEGLATLERALLGLDLTSLLAIAYLAFAATMLGYGLWGRLLSRYPASQVAPFSLLVPVVGLSASALLLGERLDTQQGAGVGLVLAGLLVNLYGARLPARAPAR